MDKKFIFDMALEYIRDNDLKAAHFAREVGISERQMQRYVNEGKELNDADAEKLYKFFGEKYPKPMSRNKNDNTDAISIKGSAKQNALELKRLKKYKYDYTAASVLVRIGWEVVVKTGVDNFDFEPYE